jgi:hypothetical protein
MPASNITIESNESCGCYLSTTVTVVSSATDSVIPGAMVTIDNIYSEITNQNGLAAFRLAYGTHKSAVSANGFITKDSDAIPDFIISTPNTSFLIYMTPITSLNENDWNNISVYPNPAKNTIFIDNLDPDYINIIEIYDLSGQVVLNQTIQYNISINVSNLVSGMYIFKVSNPSGVSISKLIKE